uniref:Protein arginine methyltransferase NDUFAF7 n=1 Tax=Timema monikensis TaxID=170555 RepID=A0A7R9HSG7_9NEOP|nr:unnamed protein product [Timema monikensis]
MQIISKEKHIAKLSNLLKIFILKNTKYASTFPVYRNCIGLSRSIGYSQEPLFLTKYLKTKMKATGPITVADYMREVLTNPVTGYYMHRDVIGDKGDFITSPEVGQLFGEMVAVWLFSEWQKVGSPNPLQLVELGPGRGSLSEDLLRVFAKFGAANIVSLHLVELSPHLSRIQAQRLCGDTTKENEPNSVENHYRSGTSLHGTPVFWYHRLQDVPRYFSCVVANEFFDALPVHKFQKTGAGWREILIDIDPNDENKFKYVISRGETLASRLFIKKTECRNHLEVSPESAVIIQHIVDRLEEDGGIALLADYGHNGTNTDTFRAFKRHQLWDPLVEPGTADLTADVDFSCLKDAAGDRVVTYGPVSQREFLINMGIAFRLEKLLKSCKPELKDRLVTGYHLMVDKEKMGDRFKFFALFPSVLKEHLKKFPLAGFHNA